MLKLYLAGAYSHPDPKIMEERFHKLNYLAGELIKQGFNVYSPISHSHPIAKEYDLKTNYNYWKKHDESIIDWADIVIIFIDNKNAYVNNTRVNEEIKYAEQIGKDIYKITEKEIVLGLFKEFIINILNKKDIHQESTYPLIKESKMEEKWNPIEDAYIEYQKWDDYHNALNVRLRCSCCGRITQHLEQHPFFYKCLNCHTILRFK